MKTALITGSSSGIGAATAALIEQQGYRVIGVSRHPQEHPQPCILYSKEAILACIAQERPDLLIHSAGFGWYGPTLSQSETDFRELWEVHVHSLFWMAKAMLTMCRKEKKQATLLAISSVAGEVPMPGMAAYGAAKAAMTQLCQALDYEYQSDMRVLVCCPGMVATPFASRAAGSPFAHPSWAMTAAQAADAIWQQIRKQQRKRVIDWRYQWISYLLPMIPQRWLFPFLYRKLIDRRATDSMESRS